VSTESSIRAGNLSRAKRIIRRRLSDPDLTLSDIARECCLSLDYLHRLFRNDGRTMWEYLKSERLQRARELLDLGTLRRMTVTELALECGFSNMSYFSTAFKRAFGLCPREVLLGHSERSDRRRRNREC
jgi:AraC-like DNA-binding protein